MGTPLDNKQRKSGAPTFTEIHKSTRKLAETSRNLQKLSETIRKLQKLLYCTKSQRKLSETYNENPDCSTFALAIGNLATEKG